MVFFEDSVTTVGKLLVNDTVFAENWPTKMTVTVEDQNIRYRYDGGTPTASSGHFVAASGTLVVANAALIKRFRVVSTTGTAKLTVTLE